jgi:hypothetical protein
MRFEAFAVAYNHIMETLTFVGPCIIVYFYSKKQPDTQYLKLILFWNNTLHVSDGLASKQPQKLYDFYLMLYVQS